MHTQPAQPATHCLQWGACIQLNAMPPALLVARLPACLPACLQVLMLSEQGVKELTLLGQNVNSYADFSSSSSSADMAAGEEAAAAAAAADPFERVYARGFRRCACLLSACQPRSLLPAKPAFPAPAPCQPTLTVLPSPLCLVCSPAPSPLPPPSPPACSVYKPRREGAASFAELLDSVAAVDPEMRIRFTSPHPKDFSDDVLQVGGWVAVFLWACCGRRGRFLPGSCDSEECLCCMRCGRTRQATSA
jgi:hypothetical protein